MTRTATRGWTVIVTASGGSVRRPDVRDGVEFRPRLNGLPRVRIPVRRDDGWTASVWDEADLEVYKDGRRLPIDTLVDVQPADDRTVLVGRGGQELLSRVQAEYDSRKAYLAAEDIVTNNTSYQANADAPNVTVSEEFLQAVDSTTDWQSALPEIADDRPLRIQTGTLETLQSHFVFEAENPDTGTFNSTVSDSAFSASNAGRANDIGTDVSYNFTTEYDIPAGNTAVAFRGDVVTDGDNPAIDVRIDGNDILTRPADTLADGLIWRSESADIGTLAAGSHTLTFEVVATGTDAIDVDVITVYDDRFAYTFDDTVDADNALAGPQEYPDAVDVVTEAVISVFGLAGARLNSTFSATDNSQQVAVRPRNGSWTTADNSESVDASFASLEPAVQARLRLSRTSSGSTSTPTDGDVGHSVDLYDLYGDVDPTPLLLNWTVDDSGVAGLNRIADYSDAIWELVWDDSAGTLSVEWTQAGQRTAEAGTAVSGFDASKSTAERYKRVAIRGSAQAVTEEITANHGTAVSLSQGPPLVSGSETVEASDGTRYERGADYEVSYQEATITTLSGGDISDGETLTVSYEYKVSGDAETSSFNSSTDQTLVETIPGLVSDRACGQAASVILDSVADPVWSATVSLSRDPSESSLVASRQFSQLPVDEDLEVHDIQQTPSGSELELGTPGAREVLEEIKQQVSVLSDQV